MEPTYVSAIIILVALSFSGVVAVLAFSGSRRAKTEGESEAIASPRNLCYECLGSHDLDSHRLSECAHECGIMPS